MCSQQDRNVHPVRPVAFLRKCSESAADPVQISCQPRPSPKMPATMMPRNFGNGNDPPGLRFDGRSASGVWARNNCRLCIELCPRKRSRLFEMACCWLTGRQNGGLLIAEVYQRHTDRPSCVPYLERTNAIRPVPYRAFNRRTSRQTGIQGILVRCRLNWS